MKNERINYNLLINLIKVLAILILGYIILKALGVQLP